MRIPGWCLLGAVGGAAGWGLRAGVVVTPVAAWGQLAGPTRVGGDGTSAFVGLAAVLAWAIGLWLAAGAVLTCAGSLPGRLGAGSRAAAALVAPAVVRRCLILLLGVGAVSWSVPAAGASGPPPSPGVATTPTQDAGSSWDWPTTPGVPAPTTPGGLGQGPVASPDPVGVPATSTAAGGLPLPLQTVTVAPPGPVTTRDAGGPVASVVVVRPGDSLWRIAQNHLPASATTREVAASWPRWWAANRVLIGDAPDLIHPGAVLAAPGSF